MSLPQYEGSVDLRVQTVFMSQATALHTGGMLQFAVNADPTNAAFASKDPGVAVVVAPATAVAALFAGVVHSSSNGNAEAGFVNIVRPAPGDVVTVAIAVGADTGDGGTITDDQQFLADGGAYAVAADDFFVLYDEDNVNNPHGTSAISAAAGLVEAVYTGVNR